ncbi:2099_t:CDS:2, partial [Funneliformis mosseae]
YVDISKLHVQSSIYNNMVTCGNACNIPVDEPAKYESDCEIENHPVNINGGGGAQAQLQPPTPTIRLILNTA